MKLEAREYVRGPYKNHKTPDLSLNKARAAVTNGSRILNDLDHRSAWARRLRDLIDDHTADLGGIDSLSSAQTALVRRASMICLQLELMEGRFAEAENGQATIRQLEAYQRCVNTLRRTLESLGLERKMKTIDAETARLVMGK